MTRVLLCSGEPVLARGFELVLRQLEGFDLLPTQDSLDGLVERLRATGPDLLLLDLTPEITYALLSELRRAMPETRVVLWVSTISTELAFQAMGLGIRGILRKTLPAALQVKCLQKVHAGELWFEKGLTDSFLSRRRVSLTKREGQLIYMLCRGLKNKEIAAGLSISEGSVKVYLSRLFQKVGVKDRFELALYGLKNTTIGQSVANEHRISGALPGLRSLMLESPAEYEEAPRRGGRELPMAT